MAADEKKKKKKLRERRIVAIEVSLLHWVFIVEKTGAFFSPMSYYTLFSGVLYEQIQTKGVGEG